MYYILHFCLSYMFHNLLKLTTNCNWQQASRAKTVGLRGCQLNGTQSIAGGRKILDHAVKSVM